MQREPHQNVATVLVDPAVLRDLELDLMSRDLWLLAGGDRAGLRRRPATGVPDPPPADRGAARGLGRRRRLGAGLGLLRRLLVRRRRAAPVGRAPSAVERAGRLRRRMSTTHAGSAAYRVSTCRTTGSRPRRATWDADAVKVDLTVLAIPAYAAAIAAEIAWQRAHPVEPGTRAGDYQTADTLASLAMGAGSLVAPYVARKVLDPVTPGRGHYARVLLAAGAAAAVLTTVGDVVRRGSARAGCPTRRPSPTMSVRSRRSWPSCARRRPSRPRGPTARRSRACTAGWRWPPWARRP